MNVSQRDQQLVQRHLDGELAPTERDAFHARLAAEPELRACVEAAQGMRGLFAAARSESFRPRAGFRAAVLDAVRQLPSRLQLEQADLAARSVAFCRRLLLAAAVLGGIGLALGSGVLGHSDSATLQADPASVQSEVERLRELVRRLPQQPGEAR